MSVDQIQEKFSPGDYRAPITKEQIEVLRQHLNRVYGRVGIDVALATKHFIDRINDHRNEPMIQIEEVAKLFYKVFAKYNSNLAKLEPNWTYELRDESSKLNLPFVLNWDPQRKVMLLIGKTIMRKDNWGTNNPQLVVEAKQEELEINDPSIRDSATITIWIDPSYRDLVGLVNKYDDLRVIQFNQGVIVWDAHDAIHHEVGRAIRQQWGWSGGRDFIVVSNHATSFSAAHHIEYRNPQEYGFRIKDITIAASGHWHIMWIEKIAKQAGVDIHARSVNESVLTEFTRPSYQDAVVRLRNAKYEKIGYGWFADVFAKIGDPYVLKLYSTGDIGYAGFLKFAMDNQDDQHVVRIKGKPMRINDEYSAVRLERLKTNGRIMIGEYEFSHLSSIIAKAYLKTTPLNDQYKGFVNVMRQRYPGWLESIYRLCDFAFREGLDEDLGTGNVMFRGNVPVLVDPLVHPKFREHSKLPGRP